MAVGLHQLPMGAIFSPLFIAIGTGATIRNAFGLPFGTQEGLSFSVRRILRLAVVLLGLQLSVIQIADVGLRGLVVLIVVLFATLFFSQWLGKVFGVEPKLAQLIATGTAVCGASAVIAMNAVTNASDEDVTYSIASVTIFGTIFMFVFPLIAALLDLGPHVYGLWAGSSIHEVAQVLAASFQFGPDAGALATVVKLSRVLMLAPILLVFSILSFKNTVTIPNRKSISPFPIFVIGFIVAVLFNSFVGIPSEVRHWLGSITTFLLSMALAALGLETDFRKLRSKGLRPLALGAASSLFIASISLALVKFIA